MEALSSHSLSNGNARTQDQYWNGKLWEMQQRRSVAHNVTDKSQRWTRIFFMSVLMKEAFFEQMLPRQAILTPRPENDALRAQ